MGLKSSAGVELGSALHQVQSREFARDCEGLCAQLGSPDGSARRWAARDLASHPQSAKALAAALEVETDASVRTVIFSSLASIGGIEVVVPMMGLLRSDDAMLRNGAIEVLAQLPDIVAPHIQSLLRDADCDVRILTVNLLGQLPHPEVPAWLRELLRSETEVNVLGAALDVLAEVAGPEFGALLKDLQRRFADEPFICFAAEQVLLRIEAP